MRVKPAIAYCADAHHLNLTTRHAAALELKNIRLPKIQMAAADRESAALEVARNLARDFIATRSRGRPDNRMKVGRVYAVFPLERVNRTLGDS